MPLSKEAGRDQHSGVSLSERLRPYAESVEVTSTERYSIASSPFAPAVSAEELVAQFPSNERDEAAAIIAGTGIVTRYIGYRNRIYSGAELTADAAGAAAYLVDRVAADRQWDRIDHLIVTSAYLPTMLTRSVLDRLAYSGTPTTGSSYRLACAGAAAAFIDTLTRPDLQGKRVVIVAAEPLSGLLDHRHFSLSQIGMPAIFGDDYAAIGFVPGDFELIAAKTVVIPDHGVIRVRPYYDVPEDVSGLTPSHYEFAEGGREILSVSPAGVLMRLTPPDSDMRSGMNGPATAKFFIRHTPGVIRDVLVAAAGRGVAAVGAVLHQPSGPVTTGIARALVRMGIDAPRFGFYLPEFGRSNSSSATALVTWQGMLERGYLNADEPFLLAAPGIGSVITGAVIRPIPRAGV